MTTTAPAINATSAIALASEQSKTHYDLAQHATTEAEKHAHLSTVRALNKAAMEMARGNMPQPLGDGVYLCESRTNAGVVYRVDVFAQQCDCANQHACWHMAASDVCEQIATRPDSDWQQLTQDETRESLNEFIDERLLALTSYSCAPTSYSCAPTGLDDDMPF